MASTTIEKLSKGDFIKALQQRYQEDSGENISQKQLGEIVTAFTETVAASLLEGKEVGFIKFGTFNLSQRAARQCRNPQRPDETIIKPACVTPVFRFSPYVRKEVESVVK